MCQPVSTKRLGALSRAQMLKLEDALWSLNHRQQNAWHLGEFMGKLVLCGELCLSHKLRVRRSTNRITYGGHVAQTRA